MSLPETTRLLYVALTSRPLPRIFELCHWDQISLFLYLKKASAFGCHGNQNSAWNGTLSSTLKEGHNRIIPVRVGETLPSGLGGDSV